MSRDFLLYTKKETSHVLFYDKNMAVTLTVRRNFMIYEWEYTQRIEGIQILISINIKADMVQKLLM